MEECRIFEDFADKMLALLELEKKANYKKSISSSKFALYGLKLIKKEINIWSGCLITFKSENDCSSQNSPFLNFRRDDFIELSSANNNDKEIGIVEVVETDFIRIAFKPPTIGMTLNQSPSSSFYISSNADCEITYKRMIGAMTRLKEYKRNPPNQLIEIFINGHRYEDIKSTFALNERYWKDRAASVEQCTGQINLITSYSPASSEDEDFSDESDSGEINSSMKDKIVYFNPTLNDLQKSAVKFAIDQLEIAIIHGPPGTGKTTTVVETIQQLVKKKLKVLVCAPSNAAVDNLGRKLLEAQQKYSFPNNPYWMLRYGHPSRVHVDCVNHSLNHLIEKHSNFSEIKSHIHQMNQLMRENRSKRKDKKFEKHWDNIQTLTKQAILHYFNKCSIVLSTLTSFSENSEYFNSVKFDVVVMDECSQGLEAAAWLVLLKVNKCILAGDHQQLPPTVISQDPRVLKPLKISLMERFLLLLGTDQMRVLTCQYRMHELIQEWPSKQFYDNKLQPHPSVANHLLCRSLFGLLPCS